MKSLLNNRYSTSEKINQTRGNYAEVKIHMIQFCQKQVVFPETNEEVSKRY